jgi:glyoxylase I family protein
MKIHIREIDHVVIRATHIETLARFYCDVLGCSVEKEQPGTGRNMDHLCLRVESFDADALKAHLSAHGARLGEQGVRYGADGFGPSLYLFDPEGNMVELKGPPEAARVTSL